MRVVVVEDDYLQAESIQTWLCDAWPHIEIERIETEQEFRDQLVIQSTHPPDAFIVDVMLRWSDPSPDIDVAPDDIREQGFSQAGLRCVELLQEGIETQQVPIVIYSILDKEEIEDSKVLRFLPHIRFLPKSSEPRHLIQLLGSLIAARKSTKEPLTITRDVFICHAAEDREEIVIPLVTALESSGISVWHDRAEIRWGDSLVSKIEQGLRISRYVLAVLSKHSVKKPWPSKEVRATLNGETLTGNAKLLPLIVGTIEEQNAIVCECGLQNERLYELWNGTPAPVVERLRERLKYKLD
jgi:hypothetical protein